MGVPGNTVNILDPTIPVDQGIFEESSTQKARLGTRLVVGDRTFRYAQMAASSNEAAGVLVCSPLMVSSCASPVLTVSAATTGATTIYITGSAIAVNAFAEGYVSVASRGLAGGGWTFRVKGNSAVASGAACAVTLYDPIPGSIGVGPAQIVPNNYKEVKPDSAVLGRAAGVLPVAVTTGNYFWLQTWGPCSPQHSAATPAGVPLMIGTAGMVAGYLAPGASSGAAIIGMNLNLIAVGTQCNPIMLTIEP